MGGGDWPVNRIVKEHYPVAELPEDLRREIGNETEVRLTIEPRTPRPTKSLTEILAQAAALRRSGAMRPVSIDEAVARIRTLRDEWDD
jgi:hypothetical protein